MVFFTILHAFNRYLENFGFLRHTICVTDYAQRYSHRVRLALVGCGSSFICILFAEATKLTERQTDSADIWSAAEVNDGAQYDDVYDMREVPEYVLSLNVCYLCIYIYSKLEIRVIAIVVVYVLGCMPLS